MLHSIKNCPLRSSLAWITVNTNKQVIHSTAEMKKLLGYDPIQKTLDRLWKPAPTTSCIVQTATRTLSVCAHSEDDIIICCTDITDLNQLYSLEQQREPASSMLMIVIRLSMYGTIEGVFPSSEEHPVHFEIGQPMMRYIHSDDLSLFCRELKHTTKQNMFRRLQLRFDTTEPYCSQNSDGNGPAFVSGHFNVISSTIPEEDGKVTCLITFDRSSTSLSQKTIAATTTSFWRCAFKCGMTIVATTRLELSKKTEYYLRNAAQSTKERPEIDRLCRVISYCIGVSQSTLKAWFNSSLDQAFEWLFHKAFYSNDDLL
ncbi:MAG: hypothetical protein EXX96DRAFT_587524 [Benjaminiella poitrasii]|nr:MAG: hypothetical protein EXX96DRAFT_587524 [Benjaminiella poitrasii]